MKIKLKSDDALTDINEALMNMPSILQDCEDQVLRKAGNTIKKNVVRVMRVSDVESLAKEVAPSNYDGSRPYMHMKDDVKTVLKRDKNGNRYVSVRGGRMTGYKWHMVDDGHVARDGSTFVPGSKFISRALASSEADINKIIDDMVGKVVG